MLIRNGRSRRVMSRFSCLGGTRLGLCADGRVTRERVADKSVTSDFAQPTTATDQILIDIISPLFLPHRHHSQASHPLTL